MNTVAVSSNIDLSETVLDRISDFCKKVLKRMKKKEWELSVLICDDPYIRSLNKRYREIDQSTDVLSFSQEEVFRDHNKIYIGDIVISLETVERQAVENGITRDRELQQLLIHGILHLAGMVHDSDEEYTEMMNRQEKIRTFFNGEKIF